MNFSSDHTGGGGGSQPNQGCLLPPPTPPVCRVCRRRIRERGGEGRRGNLNRNSGPNFDSSFRSRVLRLIAAYGIYTTISKPTDSGRHILRFCRGPTFATGNMVYFKEGPSGRDSEEGLGEGTRGRDSEEGLGGGTRGKDSREGLGGGTRREDSRKGLGGEGGGGTGGGAAKDALG